MLVTFPKRLAPTHQWSWTNRKQINFIFVFPFLLNNKTRITSRISLIFAPPFPMIEPHWLAGTTKRSVIGGIVVQVCLRSWTIEKVSSINEKKTNVFDYEHLQTFDKSYRMLLKEFRSFRPLWRYVQALCHRLCWFVRHSKENLLFRSRFSCLILLLHEWL